MPLTRRSWAWKAPICAPVAALYARTIPSLAPESSVLESREKTMQNGEEASNDL
jgi:hypothetical protein